MNNKNLKLIATKESQKCTLIENYESKIFIIKILRELIKYLKFRLSTKENNRK